MVLWWKCSNAKGTLWGNKVNKPNMVNQIGVDEEYAWWLVDELLGISAREPNISSLVLSLYLTVASTLLSGLSLALEHYQIQNTVAKILNIAGCVNGEVTQGTKATLESYIVGSSIVFRATLGPSNLDYTVKSRIEMHLVTLWRFHCKRLSRPWGPRAFSSPSLWSQVCNLIVKKIQLPEHWSIEKIKLTNGRL